MALTTQADISSLTKKGLDFIVMDYLRYPAEYPKFCNIQEIDKQTANAAEYKTLSGAARVQDGQNTIYSKVEEIRAWSYDMFIYTVGFQITRMALLNNLYPEQFPKGLAGIRDSLLTYKEYEAIALFDNAFNPISPEFVMPDGQPLCSDTHPIDIGTYSNTLAINAQLSASSLEDAIMCPQYFTDYNGRPIRVMPKKLLIGIPNIMNVKIALGSTFDPESSGNAINPISTGFIEDVIVSPYMTNANNYFVITDYADGIMLFERDKFRVNASSDPDNNNLKFSGWEAYRFAILNPRAVVGIQSFS